MKELVLGTFIKIGFNIRVLVISINFTDGYFYAAVFLGWPVKERNVIAFVN
jgi:hypothetical protein